MQEFLEPRPIGLPLEDRTRHTVYALLGILDLDMDTNLRTRTLRCPLRYGCTEQDSLM
jgi:hypothetical protein